jgi:hypothetical protein
MGNKMDKKLIKLIFKFINILVIMNIIKYRKLYLSRNLGNNDFIMLTRKVNIPLYSYNLFENHPLVKKGHAYWESDNELCIGYILDKNPEIYRPIYSHKRQDLLDIINKNIKTPFVFWNKIKSQYFITISKIKKLPLDLTKKIIEYIY